MSLKGIKPGLGGALKHKIIMSLALVLSVASFSAHAGEYDTEAWGDKFRYGAFSTLISSNILDKQFHDFVVSLSKPLEGNGHEQIQAFGGKIKKFRKAYTKLDDDQISSIIADAREDHTPSIYEEERSIVSTIEQNNAFIAGMKEHGELVPVDNLIKDNKFKSENFQFNAHRGLYNNAYRIPQNSLAAIVNAYVAGIRSVEFDVLETKDNVSIVIHDLVSNRLDGTFNLPPKYVEQHNFIEVKNTNIDVLNPLGPAAVVETTGIKHIMPTRQLLQVVHELMPEMTLYADARNNAPVSFIKLLRDHPEYRDNVVLKVYPFTLSGGMTDLVTEYAKRYKGGDKNAAYQEISAVNPHILLSLGNAETESSQNVLLSGLEGFTWERFQKEAVNLPFSHNSSNSRNLFDHQKIFSDKELIDIEMQTFKLFRWAMGFTVNTNVLVFQMSAIPSLMGIIDRVDHREYLALSDHKMKAAVHDNFMILYQRVMSEGLNLRVSGLIGDNSPAKNLKEQIQNTRFGISDRYQDFTLALWDIDGNVRQDTIKSYVYSMTGVVTENNGYAHKKMRSTKAMVDRIKELNALSGQKATYATTDMPTDLRLAFMGITGKYGLPADLVYRPSSIIKKRYNIIPAEFDPKGWTKRTCGDAYGKCPDDFDKDYQNIKTELDDIKKKNQISHDLKQAVNENVLLINKEALGLLKHDTPITREAIDPELFEKILNQNELEIKGLTSSVKERKIAFEEKYGVPFYPD